MQPSYNLMIAGAGLAGATAAYRLADKHGLLIVDPYGADGGATGAAAGLVNPFMGRKANPTWQLKPALDALDELLADAEAEDTCRRSGVFRPARSDKQQGFFADVAEKHPALASLIDAATASERFSSVSAPHGGLWIERGCSVDMTALVQTLLQQVEGAGHDVAAGWRLRDYNDSDTHVSIEIEREGEIRQVTAEKLLICVGQGFSSVSGLDALGLRAVKGQTVRVKYDGFFEDVPALSGHGYLVPTSRDTAIIGSTYEHDFTDLNPTEEQVGYLMEKAKLMLPGLGEAEILEMKAGARVYPPSSHLPWVGPVGRSRRVWFFGALGSRGMLTAPLISKQLPVYMEDIAAIPEIIRVSDTGSAS